MLLLEKWCLEIGISTDFQVGRVTFPLWPTAHRLWLRPTRTDKKHCVVLWSAYFIFLIFFFLSLFFPSWLSLFFQRLEVSKSESLRSEARECLRSYRLEKQIPFLKGIFSHTWHHFTYNLNLKCPLLSVTGMCCAVFLFFLFLFFFWTLAGKGVLVSMHWTYLRKYLTFRHWFSYLLLQEITYRYWFCLWISPLHIAIHYIICKILCYQEKLCYLL